MIRPVTCVCMLLAASSGLYLYQTKHRTRMLDKQIEATLEATEAVHERTRLLNAEWAVLNDPSRLGDLAGKFLTLRPVAPSQFVTMAELEKHLPPVREFTPSGVMPAEPAPEVPLAALAPNASHPNAPSVTTAPTPTSPPARLTQMAAATPAKPVLRVAAQPAQATNDPAEPKPEAPMALPRAVPHAPAPIRHEPMVAALVAPRSAPVSSPVMISPVLRRVIATNPPSAPTPMAQTISRVGYTSSLLGNARTTLAPPVPISSADAVVSTGAR